MSLLADTPAPNLLYVLGIPAGLLLVGVIVAYGLYRVLGKAERHPHT
jgi:hypothetical protein